VPFPLPPEPVGLGPWSTFELGDAEEVLPARLSLPAAREALPDALALLPATPTPPIPCEAGSIEMPPQPLSKATQTAAMPQELTFIATPIRNSCATPHYRKLREQWP
jgi:hypothetical protein